MSLIWFEILRQNSLKNVTFVNSFVTKNKLLKDIIEYFSIFKKLSNNYEKILYVINFSFSFYNHAGSD